jgi:hypothetical protein
LYEATGVYGAAAAVIVVEVEEEMWWKEKGLDHLPLPNPVSSNQLQAGGRVLEE